MDFIEVLRGTVGRINTLILLCAGDGTAANLGHRAGAGVIDRGREYLRREEILCQCTAVDCQATVHIVVHDMVTVSQCTVVDSQGRMLLCGSGAVAIEIGRAICKGEITC